MLRENNSNFLNMDELNQVAGGVTYEYEAYSVVIPDGETEPFDEFTRRTSALPIIIAKNSGLTLEDLLAGPSVGNSHEIAKYYWDKIIPN